MYSNIFIAVIGEIIGVGTGALTNLATPPTTYSTIDWLKTDSKCSSNEEPIPPIYSDEAVMQRQKLNFFITVNERIKVLSKCTSKLVVSCIICDIMFSDTHGHIEYIAITLTVFHIMHT